MSNDKCTLMWVDFERECEMDSNRKFSYDKKMLSIGKRAAKK